MTPSLLQDRAEVGSSAKLAVTHSSDRIAVVGGSTMDCDGIAVRDIKVNLNHNLIETLIGSNYTKWREDVEIALGLLDYEMVIEEEAPAEPPANASAEAKANKMAILIMRRSISPFVRGSITPSDNPKKFIDSIGEKYQELEKVEIGTLVGQLTNAKYNGGRCVRTHILNMLEIGNKLKALKVNVDETMMVHFAINSLPSTFKHLRSTYVAQNEKWTITDLISICVQEEQNMKKNKAEEKINMIQSFKRDFGKGKTAGKKKKEEKETKGLKLEGLKCYFCKKFGHMKRNCDKYKHWLDK
ncbi:PREDICTED: uncharacterized protein LOC107881668 [Prunus mume]|uniref:Uncharacterized protein LOC107881668 n=1 Tax=Prunus mume TaxID=102107 RepID=A0ABM1LVQ8_PRUMU|nr:PREDICTED: uncharacterized protein LOC107881668 [Prunus mume]